MGTEVSRQGVSEGRAVCVDRVQSPFREVDLSEGHGVCGNAEVSPYRRGPTFTKTRRHEASACVSCPGKVPLFL